MEYYGRYESFKTIPGTLIHLESGRGASEFTEGGFDDTACGPS
jgi:hypothetical protein